MAPVKPDAEDNEIFLVDEVEVDVDDVDDQPTPQDGPVQQGDSTAQVRQVFRADAPRRHRTIIDVGVAATLLGGVSYAVARFMLDGYLSPFNVSFQDIGLQYSDLVSTGALLTLISATVYGTAIGASFLSWQYARPYLVRKIPGIRRVTWSVLLFILLAIVAVGVYFLLARMMTVILGQDAGDDDGSNSLISATLLSSMIILVCYLLWDTARYILRTASIAEKSDDGPTELTHFARPVFTIILGVILFVALISYAHDRGVHYAHRVQAGETLEVQWIGLQLPGLRALPVSVKNADGAAAYAPFSDHCVMLLGQNDGTVIIYDPREARLYRLSGESIATADNLVGPSCGPA